MMIPLLVLSAMVLSPSTLPSRRSHLHPQQPPDRRVTVRLYNPGWTFEDVMIDGKTYTILSHEMLDVKGPSGVVIAAASKTPGHRRGDLLVVLAPLPDDTTVALR
jgi:hypothetical protein